MMESQTSRDRIGLIGDVHAEDDLLKAVLEFFARERISTVLCVGDLADGQGDIDRCIELLKKHNVVCVRGNHDRWLLAGTMRDLEDTQLLDNLAPRTREYLDSLPATCEVTTPQGLLLLCHGLGREDMLFTNGINDLARENPRRLGIPKRARFIVLGHTHSRWAGTLGDISVINAGTLRRSDCPCFAVLELGDGRAVVQFFDVDANDAAKLQLAERVPL